MKPLWKGQRREDAYEWVGGSGMAYMRSPMVATVLSSKMYLECCQHLWEWAKPLRQADHYPQHIKRAE